MDTSIIFITLCCLYVNTVIGQIIVSHRDGVIITASSQRSFFYENIWDIHHVVDGDYRTSSAICRCCGSTRLELNPWYKVVLGQEYRIQRIHVLGPTDQPYNLNALEIQLGTNESDETVLQGVNTSNTDLLELDHTLTPPQLARFITLTLRGVKTYFVLCELYVYAVCTEGTYGTYCVETCGKCQNNESCDGVSGACSECIDGYQTPLCIECKDGTYGPSCQYTCGYCFNNGSCNRTDGSCTSCAAGYKGNACVDECLAGTHGFNCKQRCGMCLDGDVCDKYTGECPNGCIDEYKGSQCSQKMTYISLPVFIGTLSAVIVVYTVVTGLGWWCYRKKLNEKTHQAANPEDISIQRPTTSSNYDALSFNNPCGETTYTELNRMS